MNLIKIISRIKLLNFWKLFILTIPHILYIWPTYRATKNCMKISTEHFGSKHYQNGQANAFRHALWNILIITYSRSAKNHFERALRWAKKITDWHEVTFFSKELPMKMDYHNNEVGRALFQKHFRFSEEQFVHTLLKLTKKAIKIDKDTDLKLLKNQLVYISDDH